jgi:hypothetical protein
VANVIVQKIARDEVNKILGINHDQDILACPSITPEESEAYERDPTVIKGPQLKALVLDFLSPSVDSAYNKAAATLVAERLYLAQSTEKWPLPTRSLAYFTDMVRDRIDRLRRQYRGAQSKQIYDVVAGVFRQESDREVFVRLILENERRLAIQRPRTRRVEVSVSYQV